MKVRFYLTVLIALVFLGCNNKPKVIPITSNSNNSNASGVFSDSGNNANTTTSDEFHAVVVNEVLPTSKYVYLNVTEGNEKYWIAVRSMEVKKGATYYYRGGLLKTNFESKEFNRVFDKIYLVSSLVSANHGNTTSGSPGSSTEANQNSTQKEDIPMHADKVVPHQGSIKIAELVKNSKKYEGKTVQIDGVCTKINAGIMDRNWIHVKDGSQDDFDLVVTSDVYVPVGQAFTMKAVVTLNKDFGAGYKYDIILEQGVLVK